MEGWNSPPQGTRRCSPHGRVLRPHAPDLNGAAVVLRHYKPAHTDSDISVQFAEANILLTGDTWWNG